jgi:hypothetical protein
MEDFTGPKDKKAVSDGDRLYPTPCARLYRFKTMIIWQPAAALTHQEPFFKKKY